MAMVKIKRKQEEEEPQTITQSLKPPERLKKQGEGGGSGCRIVILLFLLIVIVVIAAGYQFRNYYTSTVQGYVPVPHIRQSVTENTMRRVEALRTAMDLNGVVTVTFTETELNALLQKTIEETGWKGQAAISVGDNLTLDFSLPLTGIPGFKNRFVTGKSELMFAPGVNGVTIIMVDATLNNRHIPQFIINKFKGEAFKEHVLAAPGLKDIATHIGSIKIADQKVTVETRKATDHPAPGTPGAERKSAE